MSSMKKLAFVAAVGVCALGFAEEAAAAEAYVAGSIFWGASAATTAFSQANEISNFSFDVNQGLPNTTPSATALGVTNFQYSLNNVSVGVPLQDITFWNTSHAGMFNLDFLGTTVSIYGANLGNIDTTWQIGPAGFYEVTAAINDGIATATGGSVVSISAVPLPAALPMFGAALIGLGGLARRRKAAAIAA
ncbi:MAG TPA: VPLPA-CTERM sorting domain-containing protein [Telmatospirillum sp.]|nr:VPLPA-CTERM sorting domain-containing protein [Telmatospirillum sp.]